MVNSTSRFTYLLNTKPMNWTTSEQYCNDNGGHLVAYQSAEEQVGAGWACRWLAAGLP